MIMKQASTCFVLLSLLFCCCCVKEASSTNSVENSSLSVPIYGTFTEFFQYWVKVQVGNPPVEFTTVVDTGSSDFLIPSKHCKSCAGKVSEFYNYSHSSTSKVINCNDGTYDCDLGCVYHGKCGFSVSYVGITEKAFGVLDDINPMSLNVNTSTSVNFGAIFNISFGNGDILRKVRTEMLVATNNKKSRSRKEHLQQDSYPEGMWGFAFQKLNSLGTAPAFDTLVSSGTIQRDQFSMILCETGGSLLLGDLHQAASDYQFTPLNTTAGFYGFQLNNLLLNGEVVRIPSPVFTNSISIVDTGTPLLTLPPEAFTLLYKSFLGLCDVTNLTGICHVSSSSAYSTSHPPPPPDLFHNHCFSISDSEINLFPTLTLILQNGVALQYTPQDYLLPLYYCEEGTLGLAIGKEKGFTILGASILKLYNVAYDRMHSQIGFATIPGNSCS